MQSKQPQQLDKYRDKGMEEGDSRETCPRAHGVCKVPALWPPSPYPGRWQPQAGLSQGWILGREWEGDAEAEAGKPSGRGELRKGRCKI